MSRLFTSVGQSVGALASVFPKNIQDRFPLGLTGLISFLSNLQHHSSKPSILQHSAFFMVQLSHPHMTTEKKKKNKKNIVLTRRTFVGKVMSLLFNTLSRFVTAFIPGSKHLLISWLRAPSAGILEPKNIKSVTVSIVSPSICHEVLELDAMGQLFVSSDFLIHFLFTVLCSDVILRLFMSFVKLWEESI